MFHKLKQLGLQQVRIQQGQKRPLDTPERKIKIEGQGER